MGQHGQSFQIYDGQNKITEIETRLRAGLILVSIEMTKLTWVV